MKAKCISIKKLKTHEFHTTLRKLGAEQQTWVRKTEICSEIQDRAIKSILKPLSNLLLAYLIATSLRVNDLIAVKVSTFEASVPAAYFLFATSFVLLITSIAFNHLSVAMTLKSSLAGKMLLNGFSATTYDVLQNRSENGLGLTVYTNSFFKEYLPISSWLSLVILFGIFVILVPIAAFGYYVFTELFSFVWSAESSIPERVSAGAGAMMTVSAGLNVLIFHLPLPMKKNTYAIRWGFLYRLAPHQSDDQKFSRWINEKKV